MSNNIDEEILIKQTLTEAYTQDVVVRLIKRGCTSYRHRCCYQFMMGQLHPCDNCVVRHEVSHCEPCNPNKNRKNDKQ